MRWLDKTIFELSAFSVTGLKHFLQSAPLDGPLEPVAKPLVQEIAGRLRFLEETGVGYLTLDRRGESLSRGETQRIRLAAQLGSGLAGVLYVLDEPSVGLHPHDIEKLVSLLEELRENGNSVLVVEHDELIIRRADYVIDLGPGAGKHGGEVVAEGTPQEISRNDLSATGRWLSGSFQVSPQVSPE